MKKLSEYIWAWTHGRNNAADKYLLAVLGVILFMFVIVLLVLQHTTRNDLRAAHETEFVEEARRQADGLGFFFNDRRNDLDDLAVSPSLEAYFLNRDLANLEEIARIMRRLVDTRRSGGKADAVYERMVMVDDAGGVLIGVPSIGANTSGTSQDVNLPELLVKDGTEAVVRFDGCPAAPVVVVLRPLFRKGRFVGQVAAWLRWGPIQEHRLSLGRRQAAVAIAEDGGCAFYADAPTEELRTSLAWRGAGTANGGAMATVTASGDRIVTVAVPVATTSFGFVASIREATLYVGNTSAWLIGGLYGLTFLLFVSGAVVWRSGLRRERLESELRDAQKLEAVGQLAGGIAHEINTPSQYISNNLTFLAEAHATLFALVRGCLALIDDLKDREDLAERMREIDNLRRGADLDFLTAEIPSATEQSIFGIKQISRIVLAMKEFSHPGAQGKALTDLNRAIENTITISRNEWKHVAKVETDFDPALPAVICLPGEITQVLLNLLVNAAHAVRAAGHDAANGSIRIATAIEGDAAVVRVEDNGTGIPEAIRGKVFNPFFTTKAVGKGTGQGLTIARDIVVNKHGGSIRFETLTGKGTTFIIHLPIRGVVKGRNGDGKSATTGVPTRESI
jgi:signal transduction histidine kinase